MNDLEVKTSISTSEFRLIMLFFLIVILNGITLQVNGFTFDLGITDAWMDKLYAATIGWALFRQAKKAK